MKSKRFCGIVFIGGGSSWAYAESPDKAAAAAAKTCKKDWKTLFEFEFKQELKVCVYDMKQHEGWYADHSGVFDQDTHEKIPMLEVMTVTA